ncbi:MAG: S9 family peptidase [Odoribacter splanchnicus]
MKIGILLILVYWLGLAGSLRAQPAEIDSTAYTRWRRIDDYALSENGLWAKYRYVYIDNAGANKKEKERYYFYHTRFGKVQVVEQAGYPEFFAGGDWVYYNDLKNPDQEVTCLMELQTGRKIVWQREGEPDCDLTYPLVNYRNRAEERVFLCLERMDSVVYRDMGYFVLAGGNREILYVCKTPRGHELRYGELFRPDTHRMLFRDTSCTLGRIALRSEQGTFEVQPEGSRSSRTQYYSFSLNGDIRKLADTGEWDLPSEIRQRIRAVRKLGDGTLWELEVMSSRSGEQRPDPETIKRDSSFELELWSWNDPVIQSVQAVSGYRKPMPRPDRYIYDSRNRECRKVCEGVYASIRYQPGQVPRYVLLTDNRAFQQQKDWRYIERKDYALVDLRDGKCRPFTAGQTQQACWSPDGRYVVFYDDHRQGWYVLDPERFEVEALSEAIGFPLYDELCDRPHPAEPYGLAGWSKDGKQVYLYDRFDIWRVDLDDKAHPDCLTRGIGRRDSLVLRFLNVYEMESLTIDEAQPLWLIMTDWKTRNNGIGRITPGGKLKKDLYGEFMFQAAGMSKDHKYLLLSRQSFAEGRNLWVYHFPTHKCKRISDANPHHNGYRWGSVRMVEWTNGAGKRNQGLLYLPYHYDASRNYPLIVNYYETHAQEIQIYQVPGWSSAMLDIPTFLSRGYVIFRPDVYFTVGEPARSVYDAVVSGVEELVKQGIADPERIGVQGHSWSGCTVSQLITMTDIFRCASIGAGVVNMIGAYTALRTGSGNTRMFMYEDWQCRMGKSLWEDPDAYIRNSAILRADRITAPVLILHNDEDEAVEYYEGRNLFLALRRLQKPAWLLNYKGEKHFIGTPAAQRDWSLRMLQFFDHYLKGAPAPRWMVEGININERGKDQKYDLLE